MLHLLFVDDVLLFDEGPVEEWSSYSKILKLLCLAIGREISNAKSIMLGNLLVDDVK